MGSTIDHIDKRILFELDRNARIPDTQLAKIIRKSKESVRYRIKKLEEEKVILSFSTWIDISKLGYQSGKIYLKLLNKPQQKERLKEFVKKDKRLFWLGVAEGSWNIGLTYFVKSNREFFELKNDLFSKFKDLIIEGSIASLVEVNVHEKTFLYKTEAKWKSIFSFEEAYKLDELEKKILKELFQNSRINIVDIAHKHKVSVDKIRTRIRNLEQNKIISRYTVVIDYNKLGYEFYKTFLYFKNLTKEDESSLMNYCKNSENIIHLVKQISPWDVELEIMCQSYQEYNEIISAITKNFAEIIQKVETAIMSEDHVFPAKEMVFE